MTDECPDLKCHEDLMMKMYNLKEDLKQCINLKVGKVSVWVALVAVGLPLLGINLTIWSEVSHAEKIYVTKEEMKKHADDITACKELMKRLPGDIEQIRKDLQDNAEDTKEILRYLRDNKDKGHDR